MNLWVLTTTVEGSGIKKDVPCTQQHLINKVYQNHVCLSSHACAKLKAKYTSTISIRKLAP